MPMTLRLAAVLLAFPQQHTTQDPVASPHHPGPRHLEGWTLSWHLPPEDGGSLVPNTLVIARGTHILRRIEGDSFVWQWSFLHNGREIALETGALHGEQTCLRIATWTGSILQKLACNAPGAPPWAVALDNAAPGTFSGLVQDR